MTRLPRITPRKLLSTLLRSDFYIHHQTGSHINLRHHHNNLLHVVVPFHNRDLSPKTLASIIKQAGLTVDELKKLL